MKLKLIISAIIFLTAPGVKAERILHIPMDIKAGGLLEEKISGRKLAVTGTHAPENIPGAAGNALRFDGYSTTVKGTIPVGKDLPKCTFAMWVAPETYPIMKHDEASSERALIGGTLSHSGKTGWGFTLGYTGKYAFEAYSGGWKVEISANDILPTFEWSHLVAVCDGETGNARLYRNGNVVGEGRCMAISHESENLYLGKGEEDLKSGIFTTNTFNGLADELEVFDEVLSENAIKAYRAENCADLTIPESRFAGDRLRPVFHGMPGANWTNECHGMLYSGGKFHLFFQKNANGPYMSRLHWGHLSSPNLYDWEEEKIALMPGEPYDIKGCWSGYVFTDPVVGKNVPTAIYTGVDYARAVIASAQSDDETLTEWKKNRTNPIINGRPNGLSDDFRDPFFFRCGEKAYIIVGSSKNGIGTTTLHEYNPVTGMWSNDGRLFFSGKDKASCGEFWEMPNVTRMTNGKWLFTCTPQNTSEGVRTLYWTGDIGADGTFVPDNLSQQPRRVELISRDGYGLLSPTVYPPDGKTIALGIVPDKLSGQDNYNLGWAHTYSFPREWTIGPDGFLWQKPYEGLRELRSDKYHETFESGTLNGVKVAEELTGRRIEFLGKFIVGNVPFGCRLLKNASGAAEISYNPVDNRLTVDLTSVNRLINDQHVYNGMYQCELPERPASGSEMTLNVFLDGSVLDIFINERWATSIRVFATDPDAEGIEIFSNGPTELNHAEIWKLSSEVTPAGVTEIFRNTERQNTMYDLSGHIVRDNMRGCITIADGRKILERR